MQGTINYILQYFAIWFFFQLHIDCRQSTYTHYTDLNKFIICILRLKFCYSHNNIRMSKVNIKLILLLYASYTAQTFIIPVNCIRYCISYVGYWSKIFGFYLSNFLERSLQISSFTFFSRILWIFSCQYRGFYC